MATMNGQEDTIVELMRSRQWKQAFNLCEKRIKRAPGSDFWVVIRIKILLSWGEPARFQQGILEFDALLERKPPVAEFETLCEMDKLYVASEAMRDLRPKLQQMWQRAAASQPQDEQLHIQWYQSKFNEGDFRGAQSVSVSNHPVKSSELIRSIF